ncbi:MAG: hypothetical protein ABWX73_04255 [Marmoricola sp.]
MEPLSRNWQRVKRRLASQDGARRKAAERRRERVEPGAPCEHAWTLVLEQDTWSGPMRISSCSLCEAVLQEWVASHSEASQT